MSVRGLPNGILPKGRVTSSVYIYVRSRQLEGTYPGLYSTGVWISSALRVSKGWGTVEETDWHYDAHAEHWPPIEPLGIDEKAKAFRILAYERARSVKDCLHLLSVKKPVCVALEIDNSWHKPPDGVIPLPAGRTVTGSHAILLIGYDKNANMFTFRNSWGSGWGDSGYGYLPFEYFSSRLLEAWTIPASYMPSLPVIGNGNNLRTWGIDDLLGGILHGIEIFDSNADELIGWAFAVERESFLDVEELFVRPAWRRRRHAS